VIKIKKKDILKLKKDVKHDIRLCKQHIKVLKSKHYDRLVRLEYQNLVSMEIYLDDIKGSW
jgi:enamine deaminase RidA (YjgF/YER057c/UK114 family)